MDQQTGSTSSAQALVQLLRQVGKAFKQFTGAQMQQNFAGCKPSEFRVLFIIREGTKSGVHEMKEHDKNNAVFKAVSFNPCPGGASGLWPGDGQPVFAQLDGEYCGQWGCEKRYRLYLAHRRADGTGGSWGHDLCRSRNILFFP